MASTRAHLDRACAKAHVHELSIADDGDAALVERVHRKLAVQVRVAAEGGDQRVGARLKVRRYDAGGGAGTAACVAVCIVWTQHASQACRTGTQKVQQVGRGAEP